MYSRVYVEITNICNMHCSFCHGHSRPLKVMSKENFSHILEQLTGVTGYIYYHLMGEPLTHPLLPEFLRMAAEKSFRSVITTNGTLLQKRLPELLASPLHKLSISLHSFEGNSDEAFLEYLSQCAQCAQATAQAGTITVLRLWNRGFDCGRNDTALQHLQRVLPGLWTPNTKGFRIQDKLFLEWGDRFQWPDLAAPLQGEQVFCYGMQDQFGILCDGSVVPCCLDSNGVITLGNVFQQPLANILQTPRANAMRAGFSCRRASEELCRRCGYAQRFSLPDPSFKKCCRYRPKAASQKT